MKPAADVFRNLHLIIFLVKKIDYFAAFYTGKVVVGFQVRFKPAAVAVTFDHFDHSDFRKSQQRAIDSIKGNIRKICFDFLVHVVCGRVIPGCGQNPENCGPLGCDFQSVPPAFFIKFQHDFSNDPFYNFYY